MKYLVARTASVLFLALGLIGVVNANSCPDAGKSGEVRELSSDHFYTERKFNIQAGGANRLSQCKSVPGSGYHTTAPDLTLIYSNSNKARMLRFKLVGNNGCDTALLVNDSGSKWHFEDDTDGLNPIIRLPSARSGYYDVWFLNATSGDLCNGVLSIETFD